jgi:site-specific recombinase XerD
MDLNNITNINQERVAQYTICTCVNDMTPYIWHNCSTDHIKRSISKIDAFSDFGERDISLRDITSVHLVTFAKHLAEESYNRKSGEYELSGNTINRYLSVISPVFKHAAIDGFIDRTPVTKWNKVESLCYDEFFR